MRTFFVILLTLTGCGGGVTSEQLETAQGLVRPLVPKETTRNKVIEVAGEPTSESDTESIWKTGSGPCKKLTVTWTAEMTGPASLEDC